MRAVAVCNAVVAIVVMVGAGLAVFVQNRSPWWFVCGLFVCWFLAQTVKGVYGKSDDGK